MSATFTQLLATASNPEIELLAKNNGVNLADLSPANLISELEMQLRSATLLQRSILTQLPPAFGVLCTVLESSELAVPMQDLRSRAATCTEAIYRYARDEPSLQTSEHRLYGRVLLEAWRTHLSIDPSESGLLAVLRHELGLTPIDHLLVQHHPDFRELSLALASVDSNLEDMFHKGVLFFRDGAVIVPADLEGAIRLSLGMPLRNEDSRRLFAWLSNAELATILEASGLKLGGSKHERIDRLLRRLVSPISVLDSVGIARLQEIASSVGCTRSGSKDELIARIVEHFAKQLDLPAADEQDATEPPPEPKTLTEAQFRGLFAGLSNRHLAHLIENLGDVPLSGSKSVKVGNLWVSRHSESSLLLRLRSSELEELLAAHSVKGGGSKNERVDRLLASLLGKHSILGA